MISFVLMVIVGLGNRIFNVLMMIPMNNYPLWVNMISTFVYLPACFAYIWPMLKWGKQIGDEALSIPKVWRTERDELVAAYSVVT